MKQIRFQEMLCLSMRVVALSPSATLPGNRPSLNIPTSIASSNMTAKPSGSQRTTVPNRLSIFSKANMGNWTLIRRPCATFCLVVMNTPPAPTSLVRSRNRPSLDVHLALNTAAYRGYCLRWGTIFMAIHLFPYLPGILARGNSLGRQDRIFTSGWFSPSTCRLLPDKKRIGAEGRTIVAVGHVGRDDFNQCSGYLFGSIFLDAF